MDPVAHELEGKRDRCKRRVVDLLGVKTARIKRRMENCGVTLRLCGLRDLPSLRSLFETEMPSQSGGIEPKTFGSLLCFWRWATTTFRVIYVIEVAENNGRTIIGFVGLYKMSIGQSLWLSLAVFNPENRRRGYGRQALELLLGHFQKNALIGTVYVEVQRANVASLWFFRRLGFEFCGQYGERFLLEKSLTKPKRDSALFVAEDPTE